MMKRMAAVLLALCLSLGAGITAYAEGWQKSGTEWTYVDEDGKKAVSQWKKGADNQFRWLNAEGNMAVSTWADDDYYVDSEGRIVTDQWKKLPKRGAKGGQTVWYYFGNSGRCVTDGWVKISGKYYYFDEDGVMQTGRADEEPPTEAETAEEE